MVAWNMFTSQSWQLLHHQLLRLHLTLLVQRVLMDTLSMDMDTDMDMTMITDTESSRNLGKDGKTGRAGKMFPIIWFQRTLFETPIMLSTLTLDTLRSRRSKSGLRHEWTFHRTWCSVRETRLYWVSCTLQSPLSPLIRSTTTTWISTNSTIRTVICSTSSKVLFLARRENYWDDGVMSVTIKTTIRVTVLV